MAGLKKERKKARKKGKDKLGVKKFGSASLFFGNTDYFRTD